MRANTMIRKSAAAVGLLTLLLGGLAQARPAHKPGQATVVQSKQGVVNINSADEQQLCLLPGIGPAKARAIIKHRAKRKFKGSWDLVQVKGIGRTTYRRLRPFLSVKGPTTLTSKVQVKKGGKG